MNIDAVYCAAHICKHRYNNVERNRNIIFICTGTFDKDVMRSFGDATGLMRVCEWQHTEYLSFCIDKERELFPVFCQMCVGFSFRMLFNHMSSFHGLVKTKRLECDICGVKRFVGYGKVNRVKRIDAISRLFSVSSMGSCELFLHLHDFPNALVVKMKIFDNRTGSVWSHRYRWMNNDFTSAGFYRICCEPCFYAKIRTQC